MQEKNIRKKQKDVVTSREQWKKIRQTSKESKSENWSSNGQNTEETDP